MIRSLFGTSAAAAFVLTALGISPASAITLTAAGGTNNTTLTCDSPPDTTPISNYNSTASTPVAGHIDCFNAGAFANGASSASAGHVGAEATATAALDGFGSNLNTSGIYTDLFVFHSTVPGITTATVQLQLGLGGLLQASGPFAVASLEVSVVLNAAERAHLSASVDTTDPSPTHSHCASSFVGGAGCGGIFLPSAASTPLLVVPTDVGLDVPVLVQLRIDVGASAANFGSGAGAEFNNSLDFVVGGPLFLGLPDGVTVNAPDSFVFDNIFAPPGAATATAPGTLALLGVGLAALGFARRRSL